MGELPKLTILFNHPPLVAYYLRAIYSLHHFPLLQASGISFPFLLRLPGIVADSSSSLSCSKSKKMTPGLDYPLGRSWSSRSAPLSIMVSGYHGNTDSVMVMLLLLSIYFLPELARAFRPFLCAQRAG